MRGHWISTTRKLNRHYQGGGGTTPPPPIDDLTLTWQRFVTTDAFCPIGFYHEDDPTKIPAHAPNNFYNLFVKRGDYSPSSNDFYSYLDFDLAKSNKLIGPYNRLSHYYVPGPNYGSVSYNDADWITHQADEALLHNVSTFDPDYTSSTYNGLTYDDFGIRYVKFIVPKYLGSPYYNIGRNSDNNIVGQVSFPTECKIKLSAEACKEFAEQGGTNPNTQRISFKMRTSSGDYTIAGNPGDSSAANPFDFEQNGQAYVEFNVNVIIDPTGDPNVRTRVKCRIYSFFYDGFFYVDQKPHFFDINTGEELTLNHIVMTGMKYPYPLLGFCEMSPFYQPSNLYYPSYPSYADITFFLGGGTLSLNGYYDADGKARRYFTFYEKDWKPTGQPGSFVRKHGMYMQLVQEEVSENTFWATERAWHAIHGGTPYLTPSI